MCQQMVPKVPVEAKKKKRKFVLKKGKHFHPILLLVISANFVRTVVVLIQL